MRDMTSRPKIQSSVVEFEKGEEAEVVKELVGRKREEHPAPGQVIVYARSVEQTQQSAHVLGYPAFF